MALAEEAPAPARPRSSAELQQLWDQGLRGRAIRGALESWDVLMAQPKNLAWLEQALRSCGLSAEALAVQAQITRRHGAAVQAWEALIRSVLQSGDPWWARELLQKTGCRSRALETLRIEVELALGDASELINTWLRDYRDETAVECALDWWVRSGRVEEAERLLAKTEGATLWRARFAVWRNQPETARALLRRLPPSPEVRCLEAVTAVQEGRLEHAESLLRPLQDSEVRAEAGSWLATVLRKQRRYAEAMEAAQAASMVSATFNLTARLERELAYDYARIDKQERAASAVARWLRSMGLARVTKRTIGELEHAEVLYAQGLKSEDSIDRLENLLERFGGNRTLNLTVNDDGKLKAWPLPPDPRFLGANIQLVAWTRGVEAARGLYRELAVRVKGHPLFRIYQGELELWMGAYEEAERIFEDILAKTPKVLWAWIGLGASAMLQGRLREAQRIWQRGISIMRFEGPTLYVYRGECYRRQGELAKARRDLEVAVRDKPQRLSAWINLALVDGRRDALLSAEHRCVEFVPLLMEELGGSTAERLEKVLDAMRGNRSSYRVSYHLWGRVWNRTT